MAALKPQKRARTVSSLTFWMKWGRLSDGGFPETVLAANRTSGGNRRRAGRARVRSDEEAGSAAKRRSILGDVEFSGRRAG